MLYDKNGFFDASWRWLANNSLCEAL